jgi:hypothetical protein
MKVTDTFFLIELIVTMILHSQIGNERRFFDEIKISKNDVYF